MTVLPSGLRRWLQAPVRKGVGSNPTAVTKADLAMDAGSTEHWNQVSISAAHPEPLRRAPDAAAATGSGCQSLILPSTVLQVSQ